MPDELDQFINKDKEREAKKRRFINQILDEYGNYKNKHISIRGYMGRTLVDSGKPTQIPTYSSMHSLIWVANNIRMGSEMDFIRNNLDEETGKLIIDEQSAELLRQRAPDWSRQVDLAAYLIQEESHKFGTILTVISPSWVDDTNHENWGKDGRALVNAAKFVALDSAGNIGLLDLDDVLVYALDGQHRVMGIRGVNEISEGSIFEKNSEGVQQKRRWSKDDFLSLLQASTGDVSRILEEKINIEYIPAVVVGETREEATKRVRSVFNAINNQAKKPGTGENILLDENSGSSIVARKIGHHPIFINTEKKSRVEWKGSNNNSSEQIKITTLSHLKDAVNIYVKNLMTEYDWKAKFSTVPIRPHEQELELVEKNIREIFTQLEKLPVFIKLSKGTKLSILRELPSDENEKKEAHLLLWAFGFPVLFAAMSKMMMNGESLDSLIKKLIHLDEKGSFNISKPYSVWYMVVYDAQSRKIKPKKTGLPVNLMMYLLGGLNDKEKEKVFVDLVNARKIPDGDNEWIDYTGSISKIPSTLTFPE